jgi:hypothetical protein
VKTQLSDSQRQRLRNYVAAVGAYKKPVLLRILSECENDRDLIQAVIVADCFSAGGTPEEITVFLTANGVHIADIESIFHSVLGAANRPGLHGWN